MGVEITEDAQPIQAHPFSGPTAFMLGNEVRIIPSVFDILVIPVPC